MQQQIIENQPDKNFCRAQCIPSFRFPALLVHQSASSVRFCRLSPLLCRLNLRQKSGTERKASSPTIAIAQTTDDWHQSVWEHTGTRPNLLELPGNRPKASVVLLSWRIPRISCGIRADFTIRELDIEPLSRPRSLLCDSDRRSDTRTYFHFLLWGNRCTD